MSTKKNDSNTYHVFNINYNGTKSIQWRTLRHRVRVRPYQPARLPARPAGFITLLIRSSNGSKQWCYLIFLSVIWIYCLLLDDAIHNNYCTPKESYAHYFISDFFVQDSHIFSIQMTYLPILSFNLKWYKHDHLLCTNFLFLYNRERTFCPLKS